MPNLLHIDSSPLGDFSISRALTAEYTKRWRDLNPAGSVRTRDLYTTSMSPVDSAWIKAAFTPAEHRTSEDKAALSLSDELLEELRTAEFYLIGVPMHNFGIPAALKLWIDRIVRAGETFSYGDDGPVGLLTGKKATIVVSSGGVYGSDAASASMNFVEPYLRAVLGFIGVKDVEFVAAGGSAAVSAGKVERGAFLEPHLQAIHARFAA